MDYLLDFSILIHSLISQPKLSHRALILLHYLHYTSPF